MYCIIFKSLQIKTEITIRFSAIGHLGLDQPKPGVIGRSNLGRMDPHWRKWTHRVWYRFLVKMHVRKFMYGYGRKIDVCSYYNKIVQAPNSSYENYTILPRNFYQEHYEADLRSKCPRGLMGVCFTPRGATCSQCGWT